MELERQEEIVVHTIRDEDGEGKDYIYGQLYSVNLDAGQISKCPVGDLYLDDPITSMVCLDNRYIFILGGYPNHHRLGLKTKGEGKVSKHQIHTRVSRVDLINNNNNNNNSGGWIKIRPYKSLHPSPKCVTLNGKIYLFGGNLKDPIDGSFSKSPGEVFDPESRKWSFLPKPEPQMTLDTTSCSTHVSFPVLVDTVNNRIIVHFTHISSIYAYYPDRHEWECLVPHGQFCSWPKRTALIHDSRGAAMLLFHRPYPFSDFNTFHLVTKKWVNATISPSPGFDTTNLLSLKYDALFPLPSHGDGTNAAFCLAAYSPEHSDGPDVTHLTFVKFLVSLTDSGTPLITLMSHRDLDLDVRCCVHNYVSIAPRRIAFPTEAGSSSRLGNHHSRTRELKLEGDQKQD